MVHELYNSYSDIDNDSSVAYWVENPPYAASYGPFGIFIVFSGDLSTGYYWGITEMVGGAGYEWQEGMEGIGQAAYDKMISKAENGEGLNEYINENFYKKWHFKLESWRYPLY